MDDNSSIETKQTTENIMTYEYAYTNGFNMVKFDFEGNFVIIGDDVSDSDLATMENMQDVAGWEMKDL